MPPPAKTTTEGAPFSALPESATTRPAAAPPCASDLSTMPSDHLRAYVRAVWDMCAFCSANTTVDDPATITCFHSVSLPRMALENYVIAVCHKLGYDKVTLLGALVLAGRVWRATNAMPSVYAAHRLLAVCIAISGKMRHDRVWKNSDFASVCGLSGTELNALEGYVLRTIDFNAFIHAADIVDMLAGIHRAVEQRRPGHLTVAFGLPRVARRPPQTPSRAEATSTPRAIVSLLSPRSDNGSSQMATQRESCSPPANSSCSNHNDSLSLADVSSRVVRASGSGTKAVHALRGLVDGAAPQPPLERAP